ncbi:hypothetical protein [Kribbella sp. VKM Ac-2568]|uniref:hypothetical protein n=1 Tax=Kribbella sp. VKM Ac-2568 TaxID=2512219 RepID=UPI00104343D7|nr:hypothetical protein [Kribbella sp. VKM Ac-2568]TCM41133.1 hypothetical protein EV648_112190 [Kribbella sp. VKM Ac-2568]
MADGDRLVPRDSAVYQEFARLHQIAHDGSSTGINRWNGDLYATDDALWGGFSPKTGSVRLSDQLVLRHLTGAVSETEPDKQAEALATVLHESTHTAMETDAPTEANAVRSQHSLGLMEGVAELRATTDFQAFTEAAGYPGLTLTTPQYPGAHAAVDSLVTQASGPVVGRQDLIEGLTQGPGVMHFDQLAEGVVQNRLRDVVPERADDRTATRAALIETMKHDQWPDLHHSNSAEVGLAVAEEIRGKLDAKVQEIREHYSANPGQPFPAGSPNAAAARAAAPDPQRAATQTDHGRNTDLTKLPPPDASTRVMRGPQSPGQREPDAQQPSPTDHADGTQPATPALDATSPATAEQSAKQPGQAAAPNAPQELSHAAAAGTPQRAVQGAEPNAAQQTSQGADAHAAQEASEPGGRQAGGEMRFLSGQAPAAGATRQAPSLGQGARGAGAPQGAGVSREAGRTESGERGRE